jgi:hypothetical protein
LLDADGPAAAVLREYARRTSPAEVTRWLPPRGRAPLAIIRAALGTRAVVASGLLAACLGLWLSVHPPRAIGPHDGRGGAGGTEGASGSEPGGGGGRGSSAAAPTAETEARRATGWS